MRAAQTYLEGLGIPVLDLLHRGHIVEPVGQGFQLLDAMRQADGQLLGKKLRGAEKGS